MQVEIAAAKTIQKAVRIFLKRRRVARYAAAALLIQRIYRG
jgi:IQ calmodulin-binding motif